MPQKSTPPRVLVAYGPDSSDHIRKVIELTDTLRRDGIDAVVDQYNMRPQTGWMHWTLSQLKKSDFIIVVYSKLMSAADVSRTGSDCLIGGTDEAPLGAKLSFAMFRNMSSARRFDPKFEHKTPQQIPVAFSDVDDLYGPEVIRANTPSGYETLYRALTKGNRPPSLTTQDNDQAETTTERDPSHPETIDATTERDPSQCEAATTPSARLVPFLCHSSKDKDLVHGLYNKLVSCGFSPWMDKVDLIAGQLWREEIPRAIRRSDAVVIFLSRNAVSKAGYFHKEVKLALDVLDEQPEQSIYVIPVRLDDCKIPDRIGHIHCADLFEEGGFEKLVMALRSRAEQVVQASAC